MLRSLNEVYSELRKAALGAGFPTGHAEDIAHSGAALIALGEDGAGAVLQALNSGYVNSPEVPVFDSVIDHLDVAHCGTTLLEWLTVPSSPKSAEITQLDNPLLLFGMLLHCSRCHDREFMLTLSDGTSFHASAEWQRGELDRLLENASTVQLSVMPPGTGSQSVVARQSKEQGQGVEINEALWPQIKAMSAKTYVPATEQSRMGAGASINDSE